MSLFVDPMLDGFLADENPTAHDLRLELALQSERTDGRVGQAEGPSSGVDSHPPVGREVDFDGVLARCWHGRDLVGVLEPFNEC